MKAYSLQYGLRAFCSTWETPFSTDSAYLQLGERGLVAVQLLTVAARVPGVATELGPYRQVHPLHMVTITLSFWASVSGRNSRLK